jgi:hypothetical protein
MVPLKRLLEQNKTMNPFFLKYINGVFGIDKKCFMPLNPFENTIVKKIL